MDLSKCGKEDVMRAFFVTLIVSILLPLTTYGQTRPVDPTLPPIGTIISTNGLVCCSEAAARVVAEAFAEGGIEAAYRTADAQVASRECRNDVLFLRAEMTSRLSSYWHQQTTMAVYRGEILGYSQSIVIFVLFLAPGT